METEKSDLQRKHTEPYFWHYAVFYVTVGSGFIVWLGELIAVGWRGTSGVGIVAMLFGLLGLSGIQNRRLRERIDELERNGSAAGTQK